VLTDWLGTRGQPTGVPDWFSGLGFLASLRIRGVSWLAWLEDPVRRTREVAPAGEAGNLGCWGRSVSGPAGTIGVEAAVEAALDGSCKPHTSNDLRFVIRLRPQVRHSRNFKHNRYSLPDPHADILARSIFLRDVSGRNLRKGCLGGTPR
jgi:hypothetical protein